MGGLSGSLQGRLPGDGGAAASRGVGEPPALPPGEGGGWEVAGEGEGRVDSGAQ